MPEEPKLPTGMSDEVGSDRTLAGYVGAVASAEPAPGGGSVAAVVGSLAAALGEMVCNLTIGRPAYADAEPALRAALARASALRDRLLALAAADEAAYAGYLTAAGLPKGSDTEKAARRAAMQDALAVAADVPLAVGEACLELLELLEPIARLGNRHAVSDATVGAILAEAAVRSAMVNVRINAAMMRDRERAVAYERRADEAEGRARTLAARIPHASAEPGS